jgi:hypothetical protein
MKIGECKNCSSYQKLYNISYCCYTGRKCSSVKDSSCKKYEHLYKKWKTHRWDEELGMFVQIEDGEARK